MRGRSQAKQHVRASLRAVFDRRNRAPPEPLLGRLSEVLSASGTVNLPPSEHPLAQTGSKRALLCHLLSRYFLACRSSYVTVSCYEITYCSTNLGALDDQKNATLCSPEATKSVQKHGTPVVSVVVHSLWISALPEAGADSS